MQQQNVNTARKLTADEIQKLCDQLNGVALTIQSEGTPIKDGTNKPFSISLVYVKQAARKTCVMDLRVELGDAPVDISAISVLAQGDKPDCKVQGEQLSTFVIRFELPMDEYFALKAAPASAPTTTVADTSLFENYITRIMLEDNGPQQKLPPRLILDPWDGALRVKKPVA